MNNNSDTISKLSDALSNLITAYETLQKEKESVDQENINLKNKNESLEANIVELESKNSELSAKLEDLNSSNEKQGSNINSMLSKIENILSVGDKPKPNNQNTNDATSSDAPLNIDDSRKDVNEPIDNDVFEQTPTKDEAFFKPKEAEPVKVNDIQLEKKSDEKIDLNRMASLLNGFNK